MRKTTYLKKCVRQISIQYIFREAFADKVSYRVKASFRNIYRHSTYRGNLSYLPQKQHRVQYILFLENYFSFLVTHFVSIESN